MGHVDCYDSCNLFGLNGCNVCKAMFWISVIGSCFAVLSMIHGMRIQESEIKSKPPNNAFVNSMYYILKFLIFIKLLF